MSKESLTNYLNNAKQESIKKAKIPRAYYFELIFFGTFIPLILFNGYNIYAINNNIVSPLEHFIKFIMSF